MKICTKCEKEGADSDFYTHSYECKDCYRARVAKRYRRLMKDPEFQQAERVRCRERNKRLGYAKKYKKRNLNRKSAIKADWVKRNVKARKAHIVVGNAVRDGRLAKSSSCEICGSTKGRIYGHHSDYSKPLEVKWLCSRCHADVHNEIREDLLLEK